MPEVVYTIVDEADNRVIDQFLDTYQRRDCCRTFIRPDIKNPKGHTAPQRFIDILSDPNNLYIIRCKDAGKIDGDSVILHNGLKVSRQGYYGDFSEILVSNGGCHEPAEERMFQEVLHFIPNNGCMIELGSYWAFYSLWFNKHVKNARNYCIEPSREALQVGIDNCKRNGVTNIDFTEGFIGSPPMEGTAPQSGANAVRVSEFVKNKGIDVIDILHSDIQGYEMEMLTDIVGLLKDKKIRYMFISTHSDDLHKQCLALLAQCDYRIVAQADFETETFCYDGIIVACHKDTLDIPYTELGIRKHTPLRSTPLYPIAEHP